MVLTPGLNLFYIAVAEHFHKIYAILPINGRKMIATIQVEFLPLRKQ